MIEALPDAAKKRRHRNERIAAAALVALCVVATLLIFRWHLAEEEAFNRDRRYIPKPNFVTPEALLLREFVRIDTSHPEGVVKGAQWLVAQLASRGARAEVIESAPGRVNVYARIKGKQPGHGLLLFNHIDVMAPGAGWIHPPFEGVMAGNMMYGRGTVDMKALTICQLLAFGDIARSGQSPKHDIVFLATADEETGSVFGMRWLLEHRPDIFEGIAYGITEGGITEMQTEEMTYFGIEVGSKQVVNATMYGKDIESVRRARIALEPHLTSMEPHRILPVVRQFFRDLAPTRIAFREMLDDIDGTVRRGAFWRLPITYRDLTQNSIWASGPFRSGDRWAIGLKLINLPDEIPENRIAAVRKIVEPYGLSIDVHSKEGPVPSSSSDTPLFAILTDEARKRYRAHSGIEVLYRSSTDARFLRPRNIQCYGISPYPVDFFQTLAIHHQNERIRLDWFAHGVAYMRAVVKRWSLA